MRRDLEVFDIILSGPGMLNIVHYDDIGSGAVKSCSQ